MFLFFFFSFPYLLQFFIDISAFSLQSASQSIFFPPEIELFNLYFFL